MTDRELLELAAKAAGIEIKPMQINNVSRRGDDRFIGYTTEADGWPRGWFSPLTDDGDALRLAVRCGILNLDDALFYGDRSIDFQDDPYAATRRAIVRAAAEIGRSMT